MLTSLQQDLHPSLEQIVDRITGELGARYEVDGFLGTGAYATVWKVHDTITGEDFALKRFDRKAFGHSENFYREMRALFRLSHPRIVRIHNLVEIAGGARYLLLEYCAGDNLRKALCEHGPGFDTRDARHLAVSVAMALRFAHRQGVVHGDLKPENILLAANPSVFRAKEIKLADFGLATVAGGQRLSGETPEAVAGTPAYMAPEQFVGECSGASDMYALGAILHEMLSGAPLFQGSPEELARLHFYEEPPTVPDLDEHWSKTLHQLLAKSPAERPTASQLLTELSLTTASAGAEQRAAVASTTEESQRGPIDFLAVRNDSTPSFAVLGSEGVQFLRATDGSNLGSVAFNRINCGCVDEQGDLWLLQHGTIWRQIPGELRFEPTVAVDGLVSQIAVSNSEQRRIAITGDGTVSQICDTLTGTRPWTAKLRSDGLEPAICWWREQLACAEGPLRPQLAVFDHAGRRSIEIALPGLCFGIGPWTGTDYLYALVLVDGRFVVCMIDIENELVEILSWESDLVAVTVDPLGNGLSGLLNGGRIVHWSPDGKRAEHAGFEWVGAVPFFAVANDRAAILSRGSSRGKPVIHKLDVPNSAR